MAIYYQIKKSIYNSYKKIYSIIQKIIGNEYPICRIEEINFQKKIVIIHCRGINAPIKLSFDEIINDPIILSNLSSKQASWIGYYYGKHYTDGIKKRNNHSLLDFNFSINISSELNITMLDRHGNIICVNNNDHTLCTLSPIEIMKNEKIINRFDSIQACYIGILVGTSNFKINTSLPNSIKAHLKLVK